MHQEQIKIFVHSQVRQNVGFDSFRIRFRRFFVKNFCLFFFKLFLSNCSVLKQFIKFFQVFVIVIKHNNFVFYRLKIRKISHRKFVIFFRQLINDLFYPSGPFFLRFAFIKSLPGNRFANEKLIMASFLFE